MPPSSTARRAHGRGESDHRLPASSTTGKITRRVFLTAAGSVLPLLIARRLSAAAPQRIISTAPSITEALFALGLGPNVVGVSKYCDFPAQVISLPTVGSYAKPDLEAIVRLRPDLVVLQLGLAQVTERLHALAIPLLEVPHRTLDDVYTAIGLIGQTTGISGRSDALVMQMKASLRSIAERAKVLPAQRVLAILDRRQGMLTDMTAVGPDNYVNQMLSLAGATNVLAKPGLPAYPHISLETVLQEDPDVILDLSSLRASNAERQAASPGVLALWKQYPSLRAVRANRVFFATSSALLVPGPRAPQAAQLLFDYMHQGAHSARVTLPAGSTNQQGKWSIS